MTQPAVSASLRHPRGLYVLFLTEMWERFSYYGMRALLMLYLVAGIDQGGLGWSTESAGRLYGWYTGLVYLTPVIGGYLADKFIGTHRSLIIGGLIIAAGHFTLALPLGWTFFVGLALIIIGTGFFKPNVSTMVGQLYGKGDPRRDAGFTIFYMGINLGALIGTFICGYLGESKDWGWHYGFGAAGVGMVAGLIVYAFLKPKYLGDIGDVPAAKEIAKTRTKREPLTRDEKSRVLAILIAAFFVIFFWTAFEQAGSSMNIFAKDFTRRDFFGFEIPASWFQSINAAGILILAPLFASMWLRLNRAGREPSTPAKMALGLFLLALGFVAMVIGALTTAGGQLASPIWLFLAYTLHTMGELCLSPVGLSFVTKLAPAALASLLMGCWFLANFFANLLGGYIAGAMEKIGNGEYFHVFGGQADFYLIFVVSSLAAGFLLALLTPFLNRLIGGADRGGSEPARTVEPQPAAVGGNLRPAPRPRS
jgi:POT family proton-dependent oligopeptide transporter